MGINWRNPNGNEFIPTFRLACPRSFFLHCMAKEAGGPLSPKGVDEWREGHISLRLFLPFPFRSFPCVGDVSAHGICCQMWGWTWALNIRPDTQFIWSITNYIFHTLYVYGFEFPQYFHLGPCQDKSKMFTHTQCSWSIYNICICIKWYSHCIFWAWTHQGISMIKKCTSKTS